MTTAPSLTDKGTEVLDSAVDTFHAPYNRLAEVPTGTDIRGLLLAVILKFATEQYGYDDADTGDPLETLSVDAKAAGAALDVDKLRAANSDYEMDVDILSGEMSLSDLTERWGYERDHAIVLRFYQAVRSGFESVIDLDPGSTLWDPEEAYSQVFAS